MGSEQYAIARVAETLANNKIKLVAEILVGGKKGVSGGGVIDALIGNEVLRKLQTENGKPKDQPKKKDDNSDNRTE